VVVADEVSVVITVEDVVEVTVDFSVDDPELVAVLVSVELGEDDVPGCSAFQCRNVCARSS
jgi:hypothetical protein